MEETRKSSHKVIIDGRDRVSISAVNDVDSFNENEIIFLTSAGMMTDVYKRQVFCRAHPRLFFLSYRLLHLALLPEQLDLHLFLR